jgi:rare lipoprotein A
MKKLNNKRYLARLAAISALLCGCLAVAAQEVQTFEPATVKTTEFSETVVETVIDTVVATEETKAETTKAEEHAIAVKNDGIIGLASFYAAKFHGRRTASGEKFSSKLLTAAHLTLPFGTQIKVTNPKNSKSVIVRVNDRGPYVQGRLLDLSRAAADLIGITRLGVARIELEILKPENFKP